MTGHAVLIPGTLCDAGVFNAVVQLLPGWSLTFADIAASSSVGAAAAAVLTDAPERFVAVGFSLGGFVALELLERAPDRVAALVLVSGNAHPDHPDNAAGRRADAALSRQAGIEAFVRARAEAWGLADRPAVLAQVAAMAARLGPDVHARHAEMNIARPDRRATAAAARVPVLVLAGSEDPLCPPERYAAAASGTRAELVTVPGAGHYLPLEAPGAVADAIKQVGRRAGEAA